MEAAIRFSQISPAGSEHQRFLRIDVTGRSFSLCQITGVKQKKVEHEVVHTSSKVPAFRAFDWHPTTETLIAVGQSGGEATLLNIADGNQDSTSFAVRSQRLCNTVALSTQNLIAVGLDKVRTDFCLNIWDFNQRLPTNGSKGFAKTGSDPLHKLAGGEPIASLKFFNTDPRLLVAGVKGQFVRLYDLREPNAGNGLQFLTRCVHNLAINHLDENYFASCYPTSEPLVCLWDRRMVSRSNHSPVSFSGAAQAEIRQPEVSLELSSVVDNPGVIWSARFSKSKEGCLGVLSSAGQLRTYAFGKGYDVSAMAAVDDHTRKLSWHESEPRDVFLDEMQDVESSFPASFPSKIQKKRVVAFDFTTSNTKFGEPRILVMTGEGEIRMSKVRSPPEPASISPTGFFCKGSFFKAIPMLDTSKDGVAKNLDQIRRAAESKNVLRQAFKQFKQNRTLSIGQPTDLRRMSSFANQCWNADLGFFEKGVSLEDLLKLLSASRLRCQAGYLLDATKNRTVIGDSQWQESYWAWIERAERINKDGQMIQDNLDLSFVGVYNIWMEEIAIKPRLVGNSSVSLSTIIKNLVQRLNISVRRLCQTDYREHRQLCLHVSGLAWSYEEMEVIVKKLVSNQQHTKAAAIALFTSDEQLAYQALRSRSSTQMHKMLAMALAGSKQRRKTSASSSATEDSGTEGDDDWSETISSLSADLTDPYARAILAYVKSGDWTDVLEIEALPLKQRVGVAIRHLDDNDLTAYIGRVTRHVIQVGDLEGVILTGTGTTEGLGLLSSYTRVFNDLQTASLGLSVAGAAERFVAQNDRDPKAKRTIEAFREAYRSEIMRWNLKFDRVRFDVASSKALAQYSQHKPQRPKEQIRLVCNFCSGAITHFPGDGTASNISTPGASQRVGSMRTTDTMKNPLTSEKAAVTGTVCPKCGRHLPRCGVCDLWLGTPDETYAKWYITSQQQQQQQQSQNGGNNNNKSTTINGGDKNKQSSLDLSASMTGSVMTTIGPSTSTSTVRATSQHEAEEADNGGDDDASDKAAEAAKQHEKEESNREAVAMQKFTVFCVTCGHGFHAAHAKLWFEGRGGRSGGAGHRVCPVPGCECRCNG